jgi:hypothetical protein
MTISCGKFIGKQVDGPQLREAEHCWKCAYGGFFDTGDGAQVGYAASLVAITLRASATNPR